MGIQQIAKLLQKSVFTGKIIACRQNFLYAHQLRPV